MWQEDERGVSARVFAIIDLIFGSSCFALPDPPPPIPPCRRRERLRILREKFEIEESERKERQRELDDMGSEEKLSWDAVELPERNCARLVELNRKKKRSAVEKAKKEAQKDVEAKEEGATYHHCQLTEFKRYKASPALHSTFEGHKNHVHAFKLSPDRKYLVSCSADHTIRLWNVHTTKVIRTFEGHSKAVRDVDIIPGFNFADENRLIISASSDKTLRLWDARSDSSKRILKGHTDVVYGCNFSPDGNTIISCSEDASLRLWSTHEGHLIFIYNGHQSAVLSTIFSPSGRYILSASDYGSRQIKLWHAKMPVIRKPTKLGQRVFFTKSGIIKRIIFVEDPKEDFFNEPDSDDEAETLALLGGESDDEDSSSNADTNNDGESASDGAGSVSTPKNKSKNKKGASEGEKKKKSGAAGEDSESDEEKSTKQTDVVEEDGFSITVLSEGRFGKLTEATDYYPSQELIVNVRGVKPFQSFFVAAYLKKSQFDMFDVKSGGRCGSFDRASVMEQENAWLTCREGNECRAATSDTRKRNRSFNNLQFKWTAPAEGVGAVTFKSTIVPKNLDDPDMKNLYAVSYSVEETMPPRRKGNTSDSSFSASSRRAMSLKPKVKLSFDVFFNHNHMLSLFRDRELDLAEHYFTQDAKCTVPLGKLGVTKVTGAKEVVQLLSEGILGPNQVMKAVKPMTPTEKIIESRTIVIRDVLPPAKVDVNGILQPRRVIKDEGDYIDDSQTLAEYHGNQNEAKADAKAGDAEKNRDDGRDGSDDKSLDAGGSIGMMEDPVREESPERASLRKQFEKLAVLEVHMIKKMKKAQFACSEEVRNIRLPAQKPKEITNFAEENDELVHNGRYGGSQPHLQMPLPPIYPMSARSYDLAAQAARKGKQLMLSAQQSKKKHLKIDTKLLTPHGRKQLVDEMVEFMLREHDKKLEIRKQKRRGGEASLPGFENLVDMRRQKKNKYAPMTPQFVQYAQGLVNDASSGLVVENVISKHEQGALVNEPSGEEAKATIMKKPIGGVSDAARAERKSKLTWGQNEVKILAGDESLAVEPKAEPRNPNMLDDRGINDKDKDDESKTTPGELGDSQHGSAAGSLANAKVVPQHPGSDQPAEANLNASYPRANPHPSSTSAVSSIINLPPAKDDNDDLPEGRATALGPKAKLSKKEIAALKSKDGQKLRRDDFAVLPGLERAKLRRPAESNEWVNFDVDLLLAEQSGGLIRTFLEQSGRQYDGHAASINQVCFSHDERRVASCSSDKTIKIWDPVDGNMVTTLYGHSDEVMGTSFSHDGMFLVSCGLDNLVIVWNLTNGGILKKLFGHYDAVYRCIFTHNANSLMSSGCDMTIKTWNLTPNVPDAPQRPIVSEVTTNRCLMTWFPPPGYNEEITAYFIEYRIGHRGDFGSTLSVCGGDRRRRITGLIPGTAYQFRIRAMNRMGKGAWSEPSPQVITEFGVPQKMERPEVADIQSTSILVTWYAPVPSVKGSAIQNFHAQLSGYGMEFGAGPEWTITWADGKEATKKWLAEKARLDEMEKQGKGMDHPDDPKSKKKGLKSELKKMMMALRSKRDTREAKKTATKREQEAVSSIMDEINAEVEAEAKVKVDDKGEIVADNRTEEEKEAAMQEKLSKMNWMEAKAERKRLFKKREIERTKKHLEDQAARKKRREQVKREKKEGRKKQSKLEKKYKKSQALKDQAKEIESKHKKLFTQMAFRATGLSPGIMYRVRISAINTTGEGPYSEGCYSTFTLSTAPLKGDPPHLLEAELTSLFVEWSTPHDNGAAITGFMLRQCWDGAEHEFKRSTQRVLIEKLQPGTGYQFQMKSCNSEGWSEWSSISEPLMTLTKRPDTPEKPKIVGRTPVSISLKVRRPNGNGDNVYSYIVRKREMSVKKKTAWGPAGAFSAGDVENMEDWENPDNFHQVEKTPFATIEVEKLDAGSHYDFQVACRNKSGISEYSSSTFRTKTLPAKVPQKVPRCWMTKVAATSMVVNWEEPMNMGSTITAYHIEEMCRERDDWTEDMELLENHRAGKKTQLRIDALDGGFSYRFRVAARNSVGLGEFSDFCDRVETVAKDHLRAMGQGGVGGSDHDSDALQKVRSVFEQSAAAADDDDTDESEEEDDRGEEKKSNQIDEMDNGR